MVSLYSECDRYSSNEGRIYLVGAGGSRRRNLPRSAETPTLWAIMVAGVYREGEAVGAVPDGRGVPIVVARHPLRLVVVEEIASRVGHTKTNDDVSMASADVPGTSAEMDQSAPPNCSSQATRDYLSSRAGR
jgi:hypothetical protein